MLASTLYELRTFQTERGTLLARIAERDARVRELEAAATEHRRLLARIAELEAQLAELSAVRQRAQDLESLLGASRATFRRLEGVVAARDATIRQLEQDLAQNQTGAAPPPEDDLTQIKGIGPKFERALKALGERSLAQIAAWTPERIAEVAAALKIQPSRIERDGWVQRAAELAKSG